MIGLGTIVNVAAIAAGGLIGVLGGRLISERLQRTLMSAIGVSVLFVGIGGAMSQMLQLASGALITQGDNDDDSLAGDRCGCRRAFEPGG